MKHASHKDTMPTDRRAVSYRGCLITPVFLNPEQWFITRFGGFICYCVSIEDGKRIIDSLSSDIAE